MADRMIFFKTVLIGGAAEALDNIDGVDRGDGNALQDGDFAIVCESGKYYLFILDADLGGAEDAPNIIIPDTNAGDMRWQNLLNPHILYGTSATPPAATSTPDGAIYLKYTA